MPRQLNLRQIEAFKAVMENGTVSRGAEMLNISQPAMSKLIAHLEADTGLTLFDRVKGRLAPSEHAMRLHEEIDRIFAGVREVENAIDAIRREQQGRLAIGAMPALASSFVPRATTSFLKAHRKVFCSVDSLSSPRIVDRLISRKLDVGLVHSLIANPYIVLEPIMEHPLVCIMPLNHPLSSKNYIEPHDLDRVDFVMFRRDTNLGHLVQKMFDAYTVRAEAVVIADSASTVCEFVAEGLGLSLVHPLMVIGLEHRLVVRRFEPEIPSSFQLGRSVDSRNARIVDAFAHEVHVTGERISTSLLADARSSRTAPLSAVDGD